MPTFTFQEVKKPLEVFKGNMSRDIITVYQYVTGVP